MDFTSTDKAQFHSTFFDHIRAAGMEKLHTQTLGWILTTCSVVTLDDKGKIISCMIGEQVTLDATAPLNCYTEYPCPAADSDDFCTEGKNAPAASEDPSKSSERETAADSSKKKRTKYRYIDLVCTFNDHVVLVENKIKAREHSNQLVEYRQFVEKRSSWKGYRHKKYVYLTLAGDKPSCCQYRSCAYKKLVDTLQEILDRSDIEKNKDYYILRDYTDTISNLCQVLDLVDQEGQSSVELRQAILSEFNHSAQSDLAIKSPPLAMSAGVTPLDYVKSNGIGPILSAHFYNKVKDHLDELVRNHYNCLVRVEVSSMSSYSLVQINFADLMFEHPRRSTQIAQKFYLGIQTQGDKVKVNIEAENYYSSDWDDHKSFFTTKRFIKHFNHLKKKIGYNNRRPGNKYAYTSISKPLQKVVCDKSFQDGAKLCLTSTELARAIFIEITRTYPEIVSFHKNLLTIEE